MMHLSGEYNVYADKEHKYKKTYTVEYYSDVNTKIVDVYEAGVLSSSYKATGGKEYAFNSRLALNIYNTIKSSMRLCSSSSKKAFPIAFPLGVAIRVEKKKGAANHIVDRYGKELAGIEIADKDDNLFLTYIDSNIVYHEINYIELSKAEEFEEREVEIPIRSLSEISLEKDISWLRNKKYYVVNDDETAEQIFSYLDTYNGIIAYDTETTGLRINAFSKINSSYKKELEKYNEDIAPEDRIVADSLVGIIFCVEKDISYYFPCANRKFPNLYDNLESPIRKRLINNIKADYTIGKYRDLDTDMARYWRDTPAESVTSDCLLMERCRNILTTRHILAHNGPFDWKVSYCYDIDMNLKDDTMIMHQILYKFRSTTANAGEPSNLKYLSKREFNIDQLDLSDFFVNFYEDDGGSVRGGNKGKKKKNNSVKIDFSYMDLEGSRAYAPADGDLTLQLCFKYKKDLLENHREMEYIYNVEILVACAIGYMEFYGHRIDEAKIEAVKVSNKRKLLEIEHKIRVEAGYSSDIEHSIFDEIESIRTMIKDGLLEDNEDTDVQISELYNKAREEIANSEYVLNLASPAQVASLFYDKLGIPFSGEKVSVGKKVLKSYTQQRNEDGSPKYPVINYYTEWKKIDTLLSKFFEQLPNFMYPGGFIFPHYGQISTATGRMSSKKPNAQQYPKDITKIVVPRNNNVMLDADFSQIEYRTLVAMAKESHLAELFKDPDSDYHTMMASLMYGVPYSLVTPKMRSDAKSFNFGIPYGMGFASLAILLTGSRGPAQIAEAKEKYELYFKDQPNVKKFFEKVKEMALVNKYTKTYWNRYRYYSFTDKDGKISEAKKASALRQAGNAVIQGCLHGDSLIQTKDFGIVKIKDIVGNRLLVWDGDKWTRGDITYSGKKQKCIVKFSTGQEFICSPIHKFLVKSAKGNERFVECKDLRGSSVSTNPHRVVINRRYEPSDWKYSSEWAYKYRSRSNNANNVFIEDIGDSFKAGVVLGRLASDGSILQRDVGGSCILQYVAEHESEVAGKLMSYMQSLGCTSPELDVREGRNERVDRIYCYSSSLVNEVNELDIKRSIHENIFMDTELLRGFIQGMFDGDGGISGKAINLVFGNQYNFEPMCRDIQKALLFFGIRCRYRKYPYRHVLAIKTNDNKRFLEFIGFLNSKKQSDGEKLHCKSVEKLFGNTLVVESVEITNEYIDMYDVCNTDDGYYVADGVITHNTAADIYKIAVARTYKWIRDNRLYGDVLIVNMVHDEQLIEINCDKINVQRAFRDIVACMEFKIDGFPPLYVGAGVSNNWAEAKGKMAEIHPNLAEELSREADNMPLRIEQGLDANSVIEYFNDRVYDFRVQKVKDYILDSSNHNQALHPVIGGLLNLQFTDGLGSEFSGNELTRQTLKAFIEKHELGVDYRLFEIPLDELVIEDEEDLEYEDEDETDEEMDDNGNTAFQLIDESDKLFGSTPQDLIKEFGVMVSNSLKICGIDMGVVPYKEKESLVDYLCNHQVDEAEIGEDGVVEIVFLQSSNTLFRTNVWVKGVDRKKIITDYKLRVR